MALDWELILNHFEFKTLAQLKPDFQKSLAFKALQKDLLKLIKPNAERAAPPLAETLFTWNLLDDYIDRWGKSPECALSPYFLRQENYVYLFRRPNPPPPKVEEKPCLSS